MNPPQLCAERGSAASNYVARLGQAPAGRATVRNAAVGFTAMLLTYSIGTAVGHVA
jgi:VIT1/CCC1 family predicted Fe2+/Mn2+ transporter